MDWKDTAQQAAFRTEVREFIADAFPDDYQPDHQSEQSLEPEDVAGYNWTVDARSDDADRQRAARDWAEALAQKRWVAPHWPSEYGGAGLGPIEELILQEEMMRAGVPTVNGIGVNLFGPTLLQYGTEEQKEEHLPPTARGERTWAQCFSEPGAGSDLASLSTRAVRDGDEYVVNGQKVWTSLAQYADWLFVLARSDPDAHRHRGLTLLMVDSASPGVTIRPITDIRGAAPFAEIFFEEVRVPATNRIGEEHRGWYAAMATLTFERAGIGATIKYEKALSRLIDSLDDEDESRFVRADWNDSLRHEIARRHTEISVLANIARFTVSKQAAGEVPEYEASVNQLFSAELHQRMARTGAKMFGESSGLWQREGAPIGAEFAHMRLDAVAATLLAGTAEIQRNVIATRGLGLPRR
ncbi:MAG: hypothetical protein GEU79_05015 [Acidimicrobiia bacterium]|nr:hypothetical protein [Acidimicrobiia bacterium]